MVALLKGMREIAVKYKNTASPPNNPLTANIFRLLILKALCPKNRTNKNKRMPIDARANKISAADMVPDKIFTSKAIKPNRKEEKSIEINPRVFWEVMAFLIYYYTIKIEGIRWRRLPSMSEIYLIFFSFLNAPITAAKPNIDTAIIPFRIPRRAILVESGVETNFAPSSVISI